MKLRERTQKRDYTALFEDSLEDYEDVAMKPGSNPSDEEDGDSSDDDSQEYRQHPKKKAKRKARKTVTKRKALVKEAPKKKVEDPNEPKPHLPYDCIYRIMEYSDARVCHVFASSSKGIRSMLTYELVIRSAMLGLPRKHRGYSERYLWGEARGRTEKIIQGIKNDVMVLPTPRRFLSLINGNACEMKHCPGQPMDGIRGTLVSGLYACESCMLCYTVPQHHIRRDKFRNNLGSSFLVGGADMYMRIPYIDSTGQRIGPAMTMSDVDAILAGKTTKEEVTGIIDTVKKTQILELFEAASSRVNAYRNDRDQREQQEIKRLYNIKQQQIIDGLRQKYAGADWLDLALDQREDGSFTSDFVQRTVDGGIYRSRGKSIHFPKQTVNNYVKRIAGRFSSFDEDGLSFLPEGTTVVGKFWCKRWKAEFESDKMTILKKLCNLRDRDFRSLKEITFHDFAEVMLGTSYCNILVSEALPKEDMSTSSGEAFDEDLNTFWRSVNWMYDFASTFEEGCYTVYQKMLAKYSTGSTKGDDIWLNFAMVPTDDVWLSSSEST